MIPEKSQFAPRKETLKMHQQRNGIKRPKSNSSSSDKLIDDSTQKIKTAKTFHRANVLLDIRTNPQERKYPMKRVKSKE